VNAFCPCKRLRSFFCVHCRDSVHLISLLLVNRTYRQQYTVDKVDSPRGGTGPAICKLIRPEGPYDVVHLALTLDVTAKTVDDYKAQIKKVASLVKPGGKIILLEV